MGVGPWDAENIEWDEGNEPKVVAHRISPNEVMEALLDAEIWRPNQKGKTGNWKVYGKTQGGKAITMVILWDPIRMNLRPITAWPSSESEKGKYF